MAISYSALTQPSARNCSNTASSPTFFTTLRWHNLHILLAAALQNLILVCYLIAELFARRRRKFAQLLTFYPNADPGQWELAPAGQRAQL
ncbi:MAG: malate:quinone oxidoreductase [Mycobacterium sp.]|jgi:malate dehydrogenase (quinone)|nr:malate:quinone oxidoreductase [Mycobacterium sp.]